MKHGSRSHFFFFIAFVFPGILLYNPVSQAFQNTQTVKLRYAPGVETLVQSHQFFKQHDAQTYWKMAPYYITQYTNSACSIASATMIVNAALSMQLLYTSQPVANQQALLARVQSKTWKEVVQPNGIGLTLNQLKELMPKALKAYGLENYTVEAIHVNNNSKETLEKLEKTLINNEKSGKAFMIANFQHQTFTGDEKVGHFSPVAAYDAEKKRVLIMDVFRKTYEPYWVPLELFMKSMMTRDADANDFRGYLLITAKNR